MTDKEYHTCINSTKDSFCETTHTQNNKIKSGKNFEYLS